ncbi:MAG TPA: TQO small subunit DoxD [Gemmatimonadales bacterium]|nr:TQO small subunit DoxD [Gemmatimonadales bacterium]
MHQRSAGMSRPAEWLAFLRIVVGLYFVKALWQKLELVGGVLPIPMASERWIETMPKIVTRQAAENPILWYKQFLEGTVLQHPAVFAHLTAVGETAVGIGLTLGFLNGLSSAVGLAMALAYGLATQWMSPGQRGFHFVLVACMIAFYGARTGRRWGVDELIAARKPGSVLTQRPIS